MSSPETREIRRRRLQRQAEGSREAISQRRNKKLRSGKDFHPTIVKDDPWSDDYTGDEVHDEDYYLDGEHELDFED